MRCFPPGWRSKKAKHEKWGVKIPSKASPITLSSSYELHLRVSIYVWVGNKSKRKIYFAFIFYFPNWLFVRLLPGITTGRSWCRCAMISTISFRSYKYAHALVGWQSKCRTKVEQDVSRARCKYLIDREEKRCKREESQTAITCRHSLRPTHEPSLLICLLSLNCNHDSPAPAAVLISLYYHRLYSRVRLCVSDCSALRAPFGWRKHVEQKKSIHNDRIIYEMNQCQSKFQTKRFFNHQ